MSELANLLGQSWFSNVLALISIPLAIYFWVRPRQITKPTFMITAEHALSWPGSSTLPPGVQLAFEGKQVPRLARCVVRFWNAGTEDLEKSAMRSTDRLRLELHDGEILSVKMLKENKTSNRCTASKDPDNPAAVFIDFDFLGRNDGIVFGMLHTSSKARPKVKGELRNSKVRVLTDTNGFPSVRLQIPFIRRVFKEMRVTMGAALFFGMGALLVGLKPEFITQAQDFLGVKIFTSVVSSTPDWALVVVGLMYCGMSLGYLWIARRRYPESLAPPNLNAKSEAAS